MTAPASRSRTVYVLDPDTGRRVPITLTLTMVNGDPRIHASGPRRATFTEADLLNLKIAIDAMVAAATTARRTEQQAQAREAKQARWRRSQRRPQ